MIAPTNASQSGAFGGPPVEPWDNKDYDVLPREDLSATKLRWSTMKLEYMSKWYAQHRDVSRFINPKRGFFEGYVPNWNAQIDHKLIIDGKPRRCIRTLAAGMQSGLSTPSRPWWVMGLPDRDLEKFGPVKVWLEIVRDVMMRVFSRSNIYHSFHQTYEELGQFGTGAFGIHEDYETVLRTRAYTAGEYFLSNDHTGRVNGFARQLWKTVDQIVTEFGWANCSNKVQLAYKAGQRDTFVSVYELCEANTTRIEGKIGFKGMKYRQVTWEADSTDQRLAEGGYNEFPDICPRWDTVTTADTMGVGPGIYALGDVKSTYRLKKDLLLGVAKKVSPPVMISGAVQGHVNMDPNGITRYSAQVPNAGATAAYQVDIDIKDGAEFLQSFYRALEEEFYTDLFAAMLSTDATQKTAAEIAARHEEKLLLLGPVLERVFSEMFNPTIDRSFMICLRAGLIPPPPPEIMGMQLIPRYVSLLAQAQQMVATAANEKGLAFLGNMAGINPAALDVINFDEITREEMQALGVSEKCMNGPEVVAQIRKERAKQAEEAKAQHDAMAAVMAAKNLATSPLGDSNALGHLTGIHPQGGNA